MSMERNPFENIEQQFERMQRQFEQLIDRWNGEQIESPLTGTMERSMGIDLADRGDKFVLTADVPGFELDDIDLRFVDDTLHITAEHEQMEREKEEEHYLTNERRRRTLRRSVRLPEPIAEDEAEATYKNGVLTVILPKKEPTDVDGTKIDIRKQE